MDAQPDFPHLSEPHSSRTLIEHCELQAILSNLSHELCRPLISLRAGFDLLLNDTARPISPDQTGHVRTMAELCDDLLRLTRSHLDYAGLMRGARPLDIGTFTIGALIREIDHQFASVASARRIAWVCVLEGPDATVMTDASRCQQIFANLMANALKYTPEGGEVRVSGRLDGRRWLATISDDGPGIPVADVNRVFEPFYRHSREEHCRAEGIGLGLAVARELVGRLGGKISIQSGVGQGTCVSVEFPVDASEQASAAERR